MEEQSNAGEWHGDLAEKTLKYLKESDGHVYNEKFRLELKDALGSLESIKNKLVAAGLSAEDKEVYEFKARVEKENIAHLVKLLKIEMNDEEKASFEKLFPFGKKRL